MLDTGRTATLSSSDDVAFGLAMRVLAWISVGIAALWVVMSLTYPFGWDQGLFAWVGGVIVHGGMPYADAWDLKGPLVYYAYALAETVFGVHLWSVRVLDAAILAAATVAVFRSTAALTERTIARWTALFFFLWYASHSYWHTAQPDGWAGLILIAGAAPLVSRRDDTGYRRLALLGFCVGLTTLCKPLYAVFLLLPFVYAAVTTTGSRRIVASACALGAWFVPILLTAAWFAWRGALDDLIAVHLRYSALYAGLRLGSPLRGLVDYFLGSRVIAPALPIVIYGALVLWRRHRPAVLLLGSWTILVVLCVVAQNRFFAYHWLPMLPALTLLGAVGFHRVYSRMQTLACVLGGVLLLHCLAPIVLEEARFASWMAGRIDRDAYYDAYGEPGSDMKAVHWLQDRGQPGDVFIFGWNGGIAWLSERHMVSRFGFSMPLLIGPEDIRLAYRKELLEALRLHPPRYILIGTQSDQIIGQVMTLDDFPELATLVSRDYRERVRYGTIAIHEIDR